MPALLPAIALVLATGTNAPAAIEGNWMNPIGSAIIAIAPCGPALCGKVVWASARGQREVAKNTRRIVGMTVLTNVRPGPNAWTGNLYIPDDNINVSARLTPLKGRRMRLTGCALLGLLCRSQVWIRHEGPLPGGS